MKRADVFHRDQLAERLASELMSEDGSSGLFLTAPRRTGKSTFIREDLIPVINELHGSHVVYADLWEDRAADPGQVIVAAIRAELMKFDGLIMKAAKGVGLNKIKVGGLEMSLDSIGAGQGETLTKALTVLSAAVKKPVTLIIDEAQHTQTSEDGRQAMYALKAARDAMNASSGPGFRLLATGSNSDKLASLVEDKDQAFYQAPMMDLPTLDRDYLRWFRDRQKFDPKPSLEAMEAGFSACNHRPEPLRAVFKQLLLKTGLVAEEIDAVFLDAVDQSLARAKGHFLQQVQALNPLDAAVFKLMARDGKAYSPYSKGSLLDYRAHVLNDTGEVPTDVNQSAVQQALERLRGDKFVWRAGRGSYLIEDPQHTVWMVEGFTVDPTVFEQVRKIILAKDAADAVTKETSAAQPSAPGKSS